MRRVAAPTAMVVGAFACSIYGEDDTKVAPPAPVDGGSGDALDTDSGSTADAPSDGGPGCSSRALRFAGTDGLDVVLARDGWAPFLLGDGALFLEAGRLLARSSDGEAIVSFRRDGVITRVSCRTNIELSSLSGDGRLAAIRLEGPDWKSFYAGSVDWDDGELRAGVQGDPVDGGTPIASFSTIDAPPLGEKLPFVIELATSPPAFTVSIAGRFVAMSPSSPGNVTSARVVFGIRPIVDTGEEKSARYDDIECETCVAP